MAKGYAGSTGGAYSAAGKTGYNPMAGFDGRKAGQYPITQGMPGGQGMPDLFGVSFRYGNNMYSLLVTKEGYVGLQTPQGMYLLSPDGQVQKAGSKGGSIDNKVAGIYNNNKGAPPLLVPPQEYNPLNDPVAHAKLKEQYDTNMRNGYGAVPGKRGVQKASNNDSGIEKKLSPSERYARESRDYKRKQEQGSAQASAGRMNGLSPSQLEMMTANHPANSRVM